MKKITCKDDIPTSTPGPIIAAQDDQRIRLEGGSVKTVATLVVGDKIQWLPFQVFFEIETIQDM